jgi:hypothetical protein
VHRILLPGALSALFVVACVTGGSKEKADAGPSPCDGTNSCSECNTCADQSMCADEKSNCSDDSACIAINECLPLCNGNLPCEQDCYTNNSAGIARYNAWRNCVICDACPDDCAGFEDCS